MPQLIDEDTIITAQHIDDAVMNSRSKSAKDDTELPDDTLQDTISCLRWSRVHDLLTSTSWDGRLRVFHVPSIGGEKKLVSGVDALSPLLSCDFEHSGHVVAFGGQNKKLSLLDINTSQIRLAGFHDEPIKAIRFLDEVATPGRSIVATGSWDKTVRYWDIRASNQTPIAILTLPERVYAMDTKKGMLAVVTADNLVNVVDLRNPVASFAESPSIFQRSETLSTAEKQAKFMAINVAPDGHSWAVGTAGARAAVVHLDSDYREIAACSPSFTFKCHRKVNTTPSRTTDCYAVNDVCFHPVKPGILCTAGSDGTYQFWGPARRVQRSLYNDTGGAITSVAFSQSGTILAYAVGYDWSKGHAENKPDYPCKVMLHSVSEDDTKQTGALYRGQHNHVDPTMDDRL